MRDIKTKEHDRNPKVLTKASRMPKELVKKTVLEAKEKSLQGSRISEEPGGSQTPSAYAGDKVEGAMKRVATTAGKESVKVSYSAGQKAARKTYEKMQGQKRKEKNADATEAFMQDENAGMSGESTTGATKEREPIKAAERKNTQRKRAKRQNPSVAKTTNRQDIPVIRTRETVKRTVRTKETNGALVLKEAPAQCSCAVK